MLSSKCVCLALLWLQVYLVESSQNMTKESCRLSITSEGGENLNTTNICDSEYTNEVCSTFGMSFKQEDLPLGIFNGYSVEKPSYISVKGMYVMRDEDQMYYPGLNIKWKSPASEGAQQSLKGFYVELRSIDTDNLTACYLFDVDQSQEQNKIVYEFDLKFPEVQPDANYMVRVYTMPPPRPENRDDPQQFVSMRADLNIAYGMDMQPGLWSPTISYLADSSGFVEVCFNLAPPVFNFTRYDVLLIRMQKKFSAYKKIEHEVQDVTASDECVKFEGLDAGSYSLVVQVYDLHWKTPGLCQCWITESTGQHCRNVCSSKQTKFFSLAEAPAVTMTTPEVTNSTVEPLNQGSAEPETTETPVVDTTAPGVAAPSRGSTGSDGLQLGLALGISLLLLLLVAVAGGFICWRKKYCKKKKKDPLSRLPQKISRKDFSLKISSDTLQKGNAYIIGCPPRELEKKNVYILSADDHPAHKHMVDCLAKFFEVHCQCDVIYPRFSSVHQDGGFPWVVANITRSDFVIFVDSRGAERLLRAYLDKMYYPHRQLGPEGDLFTMGLKHVFSQQETEQIIPVCFRNIQACKKMLLASLEYHLPTHLPHVLQRIHHLNSYDLDFYAVNLPVRVEVLNQLPEGAALLSAIEDFITYEETNPHWLEEVFGQPAPIPAVQSSPTDSAYGSVSLSSQKALSVSTHDLSSRPTSVFEAPELEELACLELDRYGKNANGEAQKLNRSAGKRGGYYSTCGNGSRSEPEDPATSSVFTIQTSSIMECDEKSGPVSPPNRNYPQGNAMPPDYSFAVGIIPPDSASSVCCDSVSTALRGINQRNDAGPWGGASCPKQQPRGQTISESDGYSELVDIVAPDSLSDVQIDSVSNALREVNARNELNFTRGHHELTVLDEVEQPSGNAPEFDTMSV